MNKIGLTMSILLTLLTFAGPAACGTESAPSYDPEQALADGLVTLPEPGSPFIAFNIWVRTGSQDDPEGKEGLAALTAAVLDEGSTRSDAYKAILEKLYPMAAGYGATVDKEMTVFRGVVHRDNLEEYYGLLRNVFLEPAFLEEDFERVKSQVLNTVERSRRYDRDEELGKELLFWLAYEGTPYEHPVEGYVESVRSLTLDDVRGFYASRYVANNIVVGIGGGYPDGFPARVRQDFDSLPMGQVVSAPPPRPRLPDGVKVLIVDKETDATAISLGFPIDVLRGDEDFWALWLANSWFGEHRNSFSHLYQVIREDRGMNYGDYSYIEAFPRGYRTQQKPVNYGRRSQLFEIWIRPISQTTPGDLHERALFATRAAWRELKGLVDEGLPASEVDRARQFNHNFSYTFGNTAVRRVSFRIDDLYYGLPAPGFLESIRPALAELTPEGVRDALRRHLQYENMWVVFITRDAQGMKERLLSGEPTPIGYAGERPDEILAEDEEIAAFPIPVAEEDIRIMSIAEVLERGH